MANANLCRLCINPCTEYKRLYEDATVYEITIKYFDSEVIEIKQFIYNIFALNVSKYVSFISVPKKTQPN